MTNTHLRRINLKQCIAGWFVLFVAHGIGFIFVSAHEHVLITIYFIFVIASMIASGMIFCNAVNAEMVKKVTFSAANLALYIFGIWLLYSYFRVKG